MYRYGANGRQRRQCGYPGIQQSGIEPSTAWLPGKPGLNRGLALNRGQPQGKPEPSPRCPLGKPGLVADPVNWDPMVNRGPLGGPLGDPLGLLGTTLWGDPFGEPLGNHLGPLGTRPLPRLPSAAPSSRPLPRPRHPRPSPPAHALPPLPPLTRRKCTPPARKSHLTCT